MALRFVASLSTTADELSLEEERREKCWVLLSEDDIAPDSGVRKGGCDMDDVQWKWVVLGYLLWPC